MVQVTFSEDYDHQVSKRKTVAYKRGWSGDISKAHADGAAKAGALETGPAPPEAEAKPAAAGTSSPGTTTEAKNLKG